MQGSGRPLRGARPTPPAGVTGSPTTHPHRSSSPQPRVPVPAVAAGVRRGVAVGGCGGADHRAIRRGLARGGPAAPLGNRLACESDYRTFSTRSRFSRYPRGRAPDTARAASSAGTYRSTAAFRASTSIFRTAAMRLSRTLTGRTRAAACSSDNHSYRSCSCDSPT